MPAAAVVHTAQVAWSFHIEPGGLVWPDPGPESPELKEALWDCAPSLSPVGTPPKLSTYWIDHVLAGLVPMPPRDPRIGGGNEWSLVREDDTVTVSWDYAEEGEVTENETIAVEERAARLSEYRAVVLQAIQEGHELDGRRWAQKNPPLLLDPS
jgi:hypothetical protein